MIHHQQLHLLLLLLAISSGIYKLVLSETTTASIVSGRYVYDVELTLSDSTVEKGSLWCCYCTSRGNKDIMNELQEFFQSVAIEKEG